MSTVPTLDTTIITAKGYESVVYLGSPKLIL